MKNTVDQGNVGKPMRRSRIWLAVGVALLTSAALLISPFACWAKAKEKVIHSFTGGDDGSRPIGTLVLDKAGNLYGVATGGGANDQGVVFELTPTGGGQWTETELYSFTGGSDGAGPEGGVIFDRAGNLYGVTGGGGKGSSGTVVELTPGANGQWTETVLYNFTGGADGGSPDTILIFDAAGDLYGTTQGGGDASCGCGTVFELTPGQGGQWTETVLHAFKGGRDGASPLLAGLVFDESGNLYGTTSGGGKHDKGTAFELAPAQGGKWKETILHSFKGIPDGLSPAAGLAFFGGNLYGTTYSGGEVCVFRDGAGAGCGTVFQMKPEAGGKWKESVIHRFRGSDGIESFATPVFDKSGNLYGTTFEGGSGNCHVCGTAFELTPTASGHWQETVLHDFGSSLSDVGTPESGLILNKAGKLFGTAVLDGKADVGGVYEITP